MDLVGYHLWIPEGRAFLPRLPNVAFSTPAAAKRYGAAGKTPNGDN